MRYQYVHWYINKYCVESLKDITFWGKPNISIRNFEGPFVHVESVAVWFSSFGRQLPFFAKWFPKLRCLDLASITLDQRFVNAPFHHLEYLYYRGSFEIMMKSISALLSLSQQVQSVDIILTDREQFTMASVLDMIRNNPRISMLNIKNIDSKPIDGMNSSELQRFRSEHPSLEFDLQNQPPGRVQRHTF